MGHLQPSCLRIAFSPLQSHRDATERAEVIQVPTAQSHLRFWRQKPALQFFIFFAVARGEQGESSSFRTQVVTLTTKSPIPSQHVRLRRALHRPPSKTSSHPKLFELKVGAHKASRRTPSSIRTTTAKRRTFPLSPQTFVLCDSLRSGSFFE